jgi:hypothetical protein
VSNGKRRKSVFVLSLANELFCIEKHNRQLAEIDRLKAERDKLKQILPKSVA